MRGDCLMTKDELLLKATEAAQAISNLQFGLGYYAAQLIDMGMANRALADELTMPEKTLSEYVNVFRYYLITSDQSVDLMTRINALRENPVLTYSDFRYARKLKRLHKGDPLAQVEHSVAYLEHMLDDNIKPTVARLEIDALLAGEPFVPMSIAWDSREEKVESDFVPTFIFQHIQALELQGKQWRVVVYEVGSDT